MGKLYIVLSLVFLVSCGKGKLDSCGTDYTYVAANCVESTKSDEVKKQKDALGTGEVQCTYTDTGDNNKEYTCKKQGETTTTPASLSACATAPSDVSDTNVCQPATDSAGVAGLTVGANQTKCTHTDSGTNYVCVE